MDRRSPVLHGLLQPTLPRRHRQGRSWSQARSHRERGGAERGWGSTAAGEGGREAVRSSHRGIRPPHRLP
uniref:Uncharacterized protein n=1 Tax=Oryza nivara TaxID=4536 RepID=A0A0E0J0M8_ORYNI